MGFVYNIGKGITDAIPSLARKVGSVLLFFFAFGMLAGYALITLGASSLYLLAPFVAIAVMLHDLDDGVVVFLLLMGMMLFFPRALPF